VKEPHDLGRPIRIAVLVPCLNEAATVGNVVRRFRAALPSAEIFVYDNNSTDATVEVATTAGALVRRENHRGKGNVVRRMFADIDADIYLMVDGDDTYDAEAAPRLVQHLESNGLDFVNGSRIEQNTKAYRFGHKVGNALLTGIVRWIFGRQFDDMLSGYKVFSRRFVKSFPAMSSGFEIETELTIHALELRMPCGEVGTAYAERPPGSHSKLHTLRDGLRILRLIFRLVREERPMQFFGWIAVVLFMAGIGFGLPIVSTFVKTGLVPRLPTALLATGLVLLSAMSAALATVLDSLATARRESKRIAYLSVPCVAMPDFQAPSRSHGIPLHSPSPYA
jgi:glycosyltransferase involved in cell wall biosynthesis